MGSNRYVSQIWNVHSKLLLVTTNFYEPASLNPDSAITIDSNVEDTKIVSRIH